MALWLGRRHVLGAVLGIVPRLLALETDVLTGVVSPVVVIPMLWAGWIGRRLQGENGEFWRIDSGLLWLLALRTFTMIGLLL